MRTAPVTAIAAAAGFAAIGVALAMPGSAALPIRPEPPKTVKATPKPAPLTTKPTLEMVFVLDTTGSMGGLIEGAKSRIWGIVNEVMAAKDRPSVRVGLVAYRDKGDAYVTKITPISSDLDKIYASLMDFKADGGGDEPENVRRALKEGVEKAGWSSRSPKVAQILFLVGDARPHEDYKEEPDVVDTTAKAVGRGIVVNTIQCGGLNGTQAVWQKIARSGEGQYFAIAQDGGVEVIATPYDKRLGELGGKIGSTYLAYGGGGGAAGASFRGGEAAKQSALEGRFAASAPVAAQADRAYNKALNMYSYNSSDFVQAVENGTVKLESVKKEDLPDELQKLPPDQLKKEMDKRIADRKAIRAEILELGKKRDAFLTEERKKRAAASGKSVGFDAAVADALRKQVAKKGIRF